MKKAREAGLVELPSISDKHNGGLDAIQEEVAGQILSEEESPNAAVNNSGNNSILDMTSPNKDAGDKEKPN